MSAVAAAGLDLSVPSQVAAIASDEEAVAAAAAYAAAIRPGAIARDRDGALPFAELRELARTGLLGIRVPRSAGGAGVFERDGRRGLPADRRRRPGGRADPAEPRLLRRHRHPLRQRRAARALPAGVPAWRTARQRALRARRQDIARLGHTATAGRRRRVRARRPKVLRDGRAHGAVAPRLRARPRRARRRRVRPARGAGRARRPGLERLRPARDVLRGVVLEDVRVPEAWVIRDPLARGRATTFGAFGQVMHAAIDAGIARGALEDGFEFLRTRRPGSRPAWSVRRTTRTCSGSPGGSTCRSAAPRRCWPRRAPRSTRRTRRPATPRRPRRRGWRSRRRAQPAATSRSRSRPRSSTSRARARPTASTASTATGDARTHTLHDPARSKHEHLGRHLVAGAAPPADHPLI